MVTQLDRLARSTRDLLNTLAAITGKQAGFRSLDDTWADTTTPHGRLVNSTRRFGGIRTRSDPYPHRRRPRPRKGAGCQARPQTETHAASEVRGHCAP